MKTPFDLLLREDGSADVIAVITQGKDLNKTIKLALTEHYDSDVLLTSEIDHVNAYGKGTFFDAKINLDGEEKIQSLSIEQTWIY